jgi:nitroreductase
MTIHPETGRETGARVMPLIVERWSPRAFDGSEILQADLDVIFEAAGWAPSAYNIQPWTFLYARRGDANWERFLDQLIPFNRNWAQNAGALVFVVSNKMSKPGTESYTHSFDAGAAWAQLALQAAALGYHSHGMIGVEFATINQALGIPDDHRLEAAVAIGRRAPAEKLPEGLREREVPSGRKPVSEIAIAGNFPAS